MILDIDVTTRAMRYIVGTTTSLGAATVNDTVADAFDGTDLIAHVYGVPIAPLQSILNEHTTTLDVTVALTRRGAIVRHPGGGCGVVVASGRVVESAGRQYVLTTTDPSWWAAGYWPIMVTATMEG